jgi:hypothetical protein
MRRFLSDTAQTKSAIAVLLAAGVSPSDQTADGRQLRRDIAFVMSQERADTQIAADPPERYIAR